MAGQNIKYLVNEIICLESCELLMTYVSINGHLLYSAGQITGGIGRFRQVVCFQLLTRLTGIAIIHETTVRYKPV